MLTEKQLKNYWDKVDVKGEDECWNWTAYRDKEGYGTIKINAVCLTHRVSAYLAGLIPSIKSRAPDDQVLHTCDNPACQNFKHFFIGSPKDNSDDKIKKGRQGVLPITKGEKNGQSKLTEDEVLEIRGAYAQGGIYQRELAKIYGVGRSQIGYIVRRKLWAHI